MDAQSARVQKSIFYKMTKKAIFPMLMKINEANYEKTLTVIILPLKLKKNYERKSSIKVWIAKDIQEKKRSSLVGLYIDHKSDKIILTINYKK